MTTPDAACDGNFVKMMIFSFQYKGFIKDVHLTPIFIMYISQIFAHFIIHCSSFMHLFVVHTRLFIICHYCKIVAASEEEARVNLGFNKKTRIKIFSHFQRKYVLLWFDMGL